MSEIYRAGLKVLRKDSRGVTKLFEAIEQLKGHYDIYAYAGDRNWLWGSRDSHVETIATLDEIVSTTQTLADGHPGAQVLQFPQQMPAPPQEELLVGPFEEYRVVVEGRMIPRLTGYKMGDDKTCLIVDGRFGIDVPNDLARQVAWALANALAVGAGYSHLGATSRDSRPFAPQAMAIDSSAP